MPLTSQKLIPLVERGMLNADVPIRNTQFHTDDAIPYLVATLPSLDAKTTGETTIITVPVGRTLIVNQAILRPVTIASPSGNPSLSIGGNASDYNDFSANAARDLSSMVKIHNALLAAGDKIAYAAGTAVKVKINTGALGTTYTIALDLLGYYY